jgi:hypothetical protein
MKNLILSFALVAFVGSISFANSTLLNSNNIEISHKQGDDEKCKKGCKKECCTKKEEEKKTSTKGEKKACCSKSKKSCTKSKEAEVKPVDTEAK